MTCLHAVALYQGLSSATVLVSHALASGFDATKINTPPLQKEVTNLGQLLAGSLSMACNVASLKNSNCSGDRTDVKPEARETFGPTMQSPACRVKAKYSGRSPSVLEAPCKAPCLIPGCQESQWARLRTP